MKNTTDIVDAPIHDDKSDYIFPEGSYFSPQFKIVGVAFIIIGISLCLRINLIGLLLLILGLTTLLAKRILIISFSLSKFRHTFSIFKFHIGKWEPLPNFESISVFTAKKSQGMSTGSQSVTATFSEIDVNLIYNRNRRLTAYTTKDYEKAMEVAHHFANKLNLKIYDATQREGKWIE